MLSVPKQYLYLVIDQTNKCVITTTNSVSTANAVSNGILNSSPMIVWFPYADTKHNIAQANRNETINYKLVRQVGNHLYTGGVSIADTHMFEPVEKTPSGRMFDLIEMDNNLITPEWIKRRQLGNFRAGLIMELEMYCERYLSRTINFCGDELLFPYLQKQIELSDPTLEIYAPGIQEWALINEIPVADAYQELKMKYESSCITVMRIHSFWNKFVNKFNKITLEDNQTRSDIFNRFEAYLIFGNI
jgi:hypothetical protein